MAAAAGAFRVESYVYPTVKRDVKDSVIGKIGPALLILRNQNTLFSLQDGKLENLLDISKTRDCLEVRAVIGNILYVAQVKGSTPHSVHLFTYNAESKAWDAAPVLLNTEYICSIFHKDFYVDEDGFYMVSRTKKGVAKLLVRREQVGSYPYKSGNIIAYQENTFTRKSITWVQINSSGNTVKSNSITISDNQNLVGFNSPAQRKFNFFLWDGRQTALFTYCGVGLPILTCIDHFPIDGMTHYRGGLTHVHRTVFDKKKLEASTSYLLDPEQAYKIVNQVSSAFSLFDGTSLYYVLNREDQQLFGWLETTSSEKPPTSKRAKTLANEMLMPTAGVTALYSFSSVVVLWKCEEHSPWIYHKEKQSFEEVFPGYAGTFSMSQESNRLFCLYMEKSEPRTILERVFV
jgi:hypothetical protein